MGLCLRADYITGNGSNVPVGKQKEDCFHRNWLESNRPFLRRSKVTNDVQKSIIGRAPNGSPISCYQLQIRKNKKM